MTEGHPTTVRGKPMRRDDVWVRSVGEEHSIFDPEGRSVHLLNETALAIWDLCDGETEPDEMVEVICDVSGLVRDVVLEDVQRTLRSFDQLKLITWRP